MKLIGQETEQEKHFRMQGEAALVQYKMNAKGQALQAALVAKGQASAEADDIVKSSEKIYQWLVEGLEEKKEPSLLEN